MGQVQDLDLQGLSAATAGLWDNRANHDASGNLFPTTGGSGTAGAILKSDQWRISVAGTLNSKNVQVEDIIIALTDSPGQTGSNWLVLQGNISDSDDVPEGATNKYTSSSTVDAAGAVMENDYNANTILAATADNTPLPLTVGASTIVGRKATGDISAMSGAEATVLLSNLVGDSGAGGTKGLVPAPAAGDGAAGLFLKANGSWHGINNLTADATPDSAADYIMTWDASAGSHKKVLINLLPNIYSSSGTISSNVRTVSLLGNTSTQYLDFLTNAGSNLFRLAGDGKLAFLTGTVSSDSVTWGTSATGLTHRFYSIDGEFMSMYDFTGNKFAALNGQASQRSLTVKRSTGADVVTLTNQGTRGQIFIDGDDAQFLVRSASSSSKIIDTAASTYSYSNWYDNSAVVRAHISTYGGGRFSVGADYVGTALAEIYGATADNSANAFIVADSAATLILKAVNDGYFVQKLKSSVITDSFLFNNSVNLYTDGTYLLGRYKNNSGTASDLVIGNVTKTSTDTLTNKRITRRVGTTTSSATPTINTDNVDYYSLTAQTVDITSFTTNLSGTPTDGQLLQISITGTAARAITWGASFEASTVALPTTTVTTNRLDVLFVWNTATSKWRCLATA